MGGSKVMIKMKIGIMDYGCEWRPGIVVED
jgi:hypothetical protein